MTHWFDMIFENKNYLVVDKKSGISMHPAGRFEKFNLLLEIEKELKYRPYTVMRLDRETSGLVVFGKTKDAAAHLSYLIRNKKIEKKYFAVVFGVSKEKEFTIDKSIGECSCDCKKGWKKCVIDETNKNNDEKNKKINTDKKVQSAITHVKLIKSSKDKKYSLLEIKTETGRQHQIRVHLASIGHPIVGDKLYIQDWIFDKCANELDYKTTKEMQDIIKSDRLLLHASYLNFEGLTFTSDLPKLFETFL